MSYTDAQVRRNMEANAKLRKIINKLIKRVEILESEKDKK